MKFLPFSYAVRNLYRDPIRFLQTVAGSAIVVFLILGAYTLNERMSETLSASGSPNTVLLVGAGSEESMQRSEVSEQAAGIAQTSIAGLYEVLGTAAVSPEIVYMGLLNLPDELQANGMIRGITPAALLVHQDVTLIEGAFPGPEEIIVGRLAWKRFGIRPEQLRPGTTLYLDEMPLTISGTFTAPGTVLESEVWMDINTLRVVAQRDTISAVALRLDGAEVADIDLFTKQRLDLELSAISEQTYYEKLAAFYQPVQTMTWMTALLIGASAIFGGFNTLYSAFASRVKETATLQVLGYKRYAILISFMQESLMTSLFGTCAGALCTILLLDGRIIYLSAGTFRLAIGPAALLIGLVTGGLLGLLGTIPPAIRCLKPALTSALRD